MNITVENDASLIFPSTCNLNGFLDGIYPIIDDWNIYICQQLFFVRKIIVPFFEKKIEF